MEVNASATHSWERILVPTIGGFVGPRTHLDILQKRQFFSLLRFQPRTVQFIA